MGGRGGKRKGNDNGFDDWGGYMAAKISKLENQFQNEMSEDAANKVSNIFANVAIFVNGYTTPTAEELKRIMLANGGIYHHYYNSRTTTHIIASNLCDAKLRKLKGDEKIVKPEWIIDSLKANTLLDCKPYTLQAETLDRGQQKLSMFAVKPITPVSEGAKPGQNGNPHKKDESSLYTSYESCETSTLNDETNLKSPLKNRDMKRAGEDDFLSEFYKRSRLHHISALGAYFKRYVSELRDTSSGSLNGLKEIEQWKAKNNIVGGYKIDQPVFMHIDMDCFFVSVGLRNHPELQGLPVVVTHAKTDAKPHSREGTNRELEFDTYRERWLKRSKFNSSESKESSADVSEVFPRLQDLDENCSMSEIASCSYEARAAGIYNGMFMGAAKKLCPSLVAIPYDFEGYKEVSTTLYGTLATYTLDLEAVSCDELYADISSTLKHSELAPLEFANHLRSIIKERTGCNASVGMGPNMLIARLATKKAKPNGSFYIPRADVDDFLKERKVEDLPGIGRSIAHRLHAMNVQTCADMRLITLGKLQNEFGNKQGLTLFNLCRGEDKRTISEGHVRKSVSADVNYGIRFSNDQEMYKFTHELSGEVSRRMEEIRVKGQLLTLKLKIRAKGAPVETAKFMGHGVCDSISRSVTLAVATRDANLIHKEVLSLLRQLKVDSVELRGIGIQLSKLLVDNAKSRQPAQNSLLNFVARGKTTTTTEDQKKFNDNEGDFNEEAAKSSEAKQPLPKVSSKGKQWKKIPTNENEINLATNAPDLSKTPEASSSSAKENNSDSYSADLPSASQIDSSVLNQLPDDIRRDILCHYEKQGISFKDLPGKNVEKECPEHNRGAEPSAAYEKNYSEDQPGPSNSNVVSKENQATEEVNMETNSVPSAGYEGIKRISDIDASFWSALPEDIKAELALELEHPRDIQEPISPDNKCWKNLLKPTKSPLKPGKVPKSPLKTISKQGVKRKTKPAQIKAKVQQQPTLVDLKIKPFNEVSISSGVSSANQLSDEISLSGATTLSEIRHLLIEWFSSTEEPEIEDRDAVCNFLANLVNNKDLHRVEPIIKFLQRWSENQNGNWKRVINEIINHTQLYVIQTYNAPLKLTTSI